MKIAIIIPDRGDRPELLNQCEKLIKGQLFPENKAPEIDVLLDNLPPESEDCDITLRYRRSYEKATAQNKYDLIFFMENDDYYSPFYLYLMILNWKAEGKPILFGTNYTYYYHIGILKFRKLIHNHRSSMMSTCVIPGLDIVWPPDSEQYTDKYLWAQFKNVAVTFNPPEIICLGIKHNIGKTGGLFHNDRFHAYKEDDSDMTFLKKHMGADYEFYKTLHEEIHHQFVDTN